MLESALTRPIRNLRSLSSRDLSAWSRANTQKRATRYTIPEKFYFSRGLAVNSQSVNQKKFAILSLYVYIENDLIHLRGHVQALTFLFISDAFFVPDCFFLMMLCTAFHVYFFCRILSWKMFIETYYTSAIFCVASNADLFVRSRLFGCLPKLYESAKLMSYSEICETTELISYSKIFDYFAYPWTKRTALMYWQLECWLYHERIFSRGLSQIRKKKNRCVSSLRGKSEDWQSLYSLLYVSSYNLS